MRIELTTTEAHTCGVKPFVLYKINYVLTKVNDVRKRYFQDLIKLRWMAEEERERHRERESVRERDRQTDRQTDRLKRRRRKWMRSIEGRKEKNVTKLGIHPAYKKRK